MFLYLLGLIVVFHIGNNLQPFNNIFHIFIITVSSILLNFISYLWPGPGTWYKIVLKLQNTNTTQNNNKKN